jgi:hypothetical protein
MSEDRRRTWAVALVLFTLTAAFAVIRTGRDALYLVGDGLLGVPRTYVAIAILSIPQATAMLWLLGRVGARPARMLVLGTLLAITVVYWWLAEPGASPAMTVCFFLVPLVFSLGFSMAWLLGTELLDHLPAERGASAFSLLGASSIVGGLFGGALARSVGPLFGPRSLLVVGAALVGVTMLASALIHRAYAAPPTGSTETDSATKGMLKVLRRRGTGLLIGIGMAAAMTGIFVDFQFYLGAAGGGSKDNTVYFANAYLFMSACSLVLQLLVAPRVTKLLGGPRTLLVLPAALVGGGSFVMTVGTVLARGGLRVLEGGLKNGVHRSGWEQSFMLFPSDERPAAKVMIDGLATRIAEGIAGVLLHYWLALASQGVGMAAFDVGWVAMVGASWITLALLVTALAWVIMTWALSRRLRSAPASSPDGAPPPHVPLPDS